MNSRKVFTKRKFSIILTATTSAIECVTKRFIMHLPSCLKPYSRILKSRTNDLTSAYPGRIVLVPVIGDHFQPLRGSDESGA